MSVWNNAESPLSSTYTICSLVLNLTYVRPLLTYFLCTFNLHPAHGVLTWIAFIILELSAKRFLGGFLFSRLSLHELNFTARRFWPGRWPLILGVLSIKSPLWKNSFDDITSMIVCFSLLFFFFTFYVSLTTKRNTN